MYLVSSSTSRDIWEICGKIKIHDTKNNTFLCNKKMNKKGTCLFFLRRTALDSGKGGLGKGGSGKSPEKIKIINRQQLSYL